MDETTRIVTVYEPREDLDKIEGCGGFKSLGLYLDHELAKEVAKNKGAFGYAAFMHEHQAIITPIGIFLLASDKPIVLESVETDQTATKVLESLTPEVIASLKRQIDKDQPNTPQKEMKRSGFKPIHRPSVGPYTPDNPCVCDKCGIPLPDSDSIERECSGKSKF